MSLDLAKVEAQVEGMVLNLKAGATQRRERVEYALDTLRRQANNLEQVKKKILSSKTTWLVAGIVDGFGLHYKAPSLPDEFTVIATDGSHIEVDRHRPARCYLINIGSVLLSYGPRPDAILDNLPQLYAGNADLAIVSPVGKGREQPIDGPLLGIKRGLAECQQLSKLAVGLPSVSPVLALADGSLILWGLEAYPEFVTETLLENGFLLCLGEMQKVTNSKQLALASYISLPRSTEVVNALRIALCPYEPADCDQYCSEQENRKCDAIAGVEDRELFASVLDAGERSALFFSQSSIVQKYYGEHRVYFFYLRVDDEIARIEIPEWVAKDESRLGLVHGLVLDQCRRGQGYPVALSEAHEQAVVREADRQNFWQLVESLLQEEHMPAPVSGKSRSKRTRWV